MIDSLKTLDEQFVLALNGLSSPMLNFVMWQLSKSWHTVIFVLIASYFFYKKQNLRTAAFFLLSIILLVSISDFTSNRVKKTFKRYRPTHNIILKDKIKLVNDERGGIYGFYSAHASNAFSITAFLFLCFYKLTRNKKLLFIFIYPFLISLSRVYLGLHYLSDVMFGALVGFVFAYAVFHLFNKYVLITNEQSS